jgi:hypothetical protein
MKATTKKTAKTAPVSRPVITDDDLLSPGIVPDVLTEEEQTATVPAPVASLPQGMTFTAADVSEMVRSAVQAAVAGITSANNQGIADSISKALTSHMGPRRLTVSELGEPKTPFNPTGRKREMLASFFHNFYPIQERFVSDAEIEYLHKLVPGSYGPPDFPISVVIKKRLDGGKPQVYIIHPDGKDDRMRAKNYAQNFALMLQKLVQEAKDQRATRRAEALALLQEDGALPTAA